MRRKVPKALEVATARAMSGPMERVSWLKETLGTKDEKQAKVLAKPVMMKFDAPSRKLVSLAAIRRISQAVVTQRYP